MIQKCIANGDEFSTEWATVLKKVPCDFLKHLSISTQKYHSKYPEHQLSPLHSLALLDNLELYKQGLAKLVDLNQENGNHKKWCP